MTELVCNGVRYVVQTIPLHGRHRRGVYKRPTDWLAATSTTTAWGRTRREAVTRLRELVSAESSCRYDDTGGEPE
jgi:hypothetical protein